MNLQMYVIKAMKIENEEINSNFINSEISLIIFQMQHNQQNWEDR